MPLSSKSKWFFIVGLLIGMPVIFVLTYGFVVPFTDSKVYIDRRTGDEYCVLSQYGFTTEITLWPNRFDFSKYGNPTAPRTRILKYTYLQRFPWKKGDGNEVSPGSRIDLLAKTMFSFQYPHTRGLRLRDIPQELVDRLMTERIAVWNSDRIEKETEALIEFYLNENERLLPPLRKNPYGRY